MPLRKNQYRNLDKYYQTRRAQAARWRLRTGCGQYLRQSWTPDEDRLVLAHDRPDRELSRQLQRSVTAISIRRSRLKAAQGREVEKKERNN